ncbi:MAG: MinD/ParA family protein [Actinomycetota bacterium]|nr:MinD/ParA family protein [Actinomycetota bacterium]
MIEKKDQAKKLRELAKEKGVPKTKTKKTAFPVRSKSRVIAITSGKGGVGKTNIAINLAIALSGRGKKVLLLDADLGLANIDVLLDLTPKYNLKHLVASEKRLADIILEGPGGIRIIPGASGIMELTELSDEERAKLILKFVDIEDESDITLIDTGAGISKNVLDFIMAAGEAVVVTTPEPTAITDAYGLIKVVSERDFDVDVGLIVNMVSGEAEGKEVFDRISLVAKQFLNKRVDSLGYIFKDVAVTKAVRMQRPWLIESPTSHASRSLLRVADLFARSDSAHPKGEGLMNFFMRLFIGGEADELG